MKMEIDFLQVLFTFLFLSDISILACSLVVILVMSWFFFLAPEIKINLSIKNKIFTSSTHEWLSLLPVDMDDLQGLSGHVVDRDVHEILNARVVKALKEIKSFNLDSITTNQ